MSIQFVLLWSDALLFVLIAAIVALVLWARRQDALRAAWSRVAKDGVAMAAATVLAAFILVGLLDSLHYRALLPAQPGAAARYAVEVNSALDALLSDLRQRAEKTYSAPLATRLYSKEALENSTQREFPRLKHGGAHLGSDRRALPLAQEHPHRLRDRHPGHAGHAAAGGGAGHPGRLLQAAGSTR
jgi:peptide/nickel transport system permease protein